MASDTFQHPKRRQRRLLIVRILFYGSVSCLGAWILASVVYQLTASHAPLRDSRPISKSADDPQEIFRCYFDTLLLFNALMSDFGRIPSATRCQSHSVKGRWEPVYAWDTHPWTVAHKRSRNSVRDLGVWRYRRYVVWSRCRLNDAEVLERNPVLAELARVHVTLDELRRALTQQVKRFNATAQPLVARIRKRMKKASGDLDRPRRRLQRERKLSRYRLRTWGFRVPEQQTCPVGF